MLVNRPLLKISLLSASPPTAPPNDKLSVLNWDYGETVSSNGVKHPFGLAMLKKMGSGEAAPTGVWVPLV